MRIEEHLKAFQEHRDAIDWAINRGIEKSHRIVGTHASRGITELLTAYLHKIGRIDAGFQINHRWFKSQKVGGKFPDFPKKNPIVAKMVELESKSENLTYGSQKSEKEVKKVIELVNELELMLKELMKDEK
ncbi:MAG: hypothetical protein HYY37_03335 [Candidatus Aenigmarchaeota archaeon]|nr:hypothetical protein [Candidatus Aenigmarchaeota archaeon]